MWWWSSTDSPHTHQRGEHTHYKHAARATPSRGNTARRDGYPVRPPAPLSRSARASHRSTAPQHQTIRLVAAREVPAGPDRPHLADGTERCTVCLPSGWSGRPPRSEPGGAPLTGRHPPAAPLRSAVSGAARRLWRHSPPGPPSGGSRGSAGRGRPRSKASSFSDAGRGGRVRPLAEAERRRGDKDGDRQRESGRPDAPQRAAVIGARTQRHVRRPELAG